MANINFQIEEFFRRDIYKFLELIPARNYEVSVMPIPETGETSISLIFYGGHLLQEEAYRLRVTYSDIQGVLKPDGHLDIMYLQYLLDTFFNHGKRIQEEPKMIEIIIIVLTAIISLTVYLIGCSITAQVIKHIKDNF